MLRRILAAWLVANLLVVRTVSWLAGGWYLGWQSPPAVIMLAELGLIMIPNVLIPVLIMRYWWPEGVRDLREALGWQWNGGRSIISGTATFIVALLPMEIINRLVGKSIPYHRPGASGPIAADSITKSPVFCLACWHLSASPSWVKKRCFAVGYKPSLASATAPGRGFCWLPSCLACAICRPISIMLAFGMQRRECGWLGSCSCMVALFAWAWPGTLDAVLTHPR